MNIIGAGAPGIARGQAELVLLRFVRPFTSAIDIFIDICSVVIS